MHPIIAKKIVAMAETKKAINNHIREGKDLKELDGKGVRFFMPL